jgi:hypothetical protein
MADKKNGVSSYSRVPNFGEQPNTADRFWKMALLSANCFNIMLAYRVLDNE